MMYFRQVKSLGIVGSMIYIPKRKTPAESNAPQGLKIHE